MAKKTSPGETPPKDKESYIFSRFLLLGLILLFIAIILELLYY